MNETRLSLQRALDRRAREVIFMFGFLNKVTDPACKMKVDKNKAKYSSEYKDEKYYFCSENCKSQFDVSPKDYVKENTTSSCCQNKTKAPANKSCC